jgi:GNAT superfamily N-acetyltransferase
LRIASRAYEADLDFQLVRDFLIETYGITQQPFNWTLERWDYCRYFVAAMRKRAPREWEDDIRVWDNDGQIVGVVSYEEAPGEAYLQIHPDHRGLEDEMMAWAEENIAVERDDDKRRLVVRAYDYDTSRQTMLDKRGYQRTEHLEHRYRRSLETSFPEPRVPDGYAVRSLRKDDDLGARCLALGLAFRDRPVDLDVYGSLQSAPGYRLDLDIVIEAPDGSFAAFALAWFDEANKIGMFEPVGTVPEHQKQGLGRAVMYEGFRRLKDLGATTAYVGAGPQPEAGALYRSVGFDEDFTDHAWTRVLN